MRSPISSEDIEIQPDFAKYFCILISGFLENALIALILDFVQKKSAEEVQLFVERRLDRWTSPNTEKILGLLGDFNADWKKKAEGFIIDDRKAAVNSLVGLRHQIAHGESVNTSIAQVKNYYKATIEVVEFIASLVDPPSQNPRQ